MELIATMLDQYGLTVTAIVVLLGAAGFVIYKLWIRNQELVDRRKPKEASPLEQVLASLQRIEKQERRYDAVTVRHEEQVKELSDRIDELQEKRVNEAQEVTRSVVRHVEHTKQAVERVSLVMETLKDAIHRRN